MEIITEKLNFFTSVGVIIGQVFLVYTVIMWLLIKFGGHSSDKAQAGRILNAIGSYGIAIGFFVALTSVILSLVYSNFIGFVPCELCWIQRIFLYPQVIILGLALWKKTKDSTIYCIALSAIGAIIAGYHFYGQSFNPGALPACNAIGGTSCAVRYFVEFGYITIPLMSLTTFLLIIASMLLAKSAGKN